MQANRHARREAKQLFRLCFVNGRLDGSRVRPVVKSILESKRRRDLTILPYFHRLVKLEWSRHMAEVESFALLPADLKASVIGNLERVYGPGLSTSFVHNPALIGGMRVKVGDDVYDGSVRAKLATLQQSLGGVY